MSGRPEFDDVASSGPSSLGSEKASSSRPPSRIGRLCGGVTKPSLPPTPQGQSMDHSGINRKLTDVQECDENEAETSTYSLFNTRYSLSSNNSMDTLWDLHPRRLSEAGLRRHSDTVALTENTDIFIIGMRVWVGGTKPGQIAYIGETQFAPGEWAGIALDEPIGKNDGSVGGKRYFQCEPKKGVFARLTRLTLDPISYHDVPGDIRSTSISPLDCARKVTSPTSSVRSIPFRSPPSPSTSVTSLSSTLHVDFKIGDRVIVKSSQGSKPGTLRYMGLTDFANGDWCGVELDDPLGKNDGSVEGKRYFTCQPKFGLFAPLAKVSKSPSNRKPGPCAIHKDGSLRRVNSRESLTSGTSAASRTSRASRVRAVGITPVATQKRVPTSTPSFRSLQDSVKEKEVYIEKLLKERDLERAQVTRAATQADDAEQKLLKLQDKFDQLKLDDASTCAKLESQIYSLKANLEEERHRNEDLSFRLEEESIDKGELEKNLAELKKLCENSKKRIQELEEGASSKQNQEEKFAAETNDKEIVLKKQAEEIKELNSKVSELQNLLHEKNAGCEKLHHDLEEYQRQAHKDIEKIKMELSSKTLDLETSRETILERDKEVQRLQEEIKRFSAALSTDKDDMTKKLNEADAKNIDLEGKLNELQAVRAKELTENQELLVTKAKELENLSAEHTTLKEELKQALQTEASNLAEMCQKDEKLKELLEETEKNKETLLEIERVKIQLESVNTAKDEECKKLSATVCSLEQSLGEHKSIISAREKEIKQFTTLLDESNTTQSVVNELRSEVQTLKESEKNYYNLTQETKLKLEIATKENNQLQESLHVAKSQSSELQNEITQHKSDISMLNMKLTENDALVSQIRKEVEKVELQKKENHEEACKLKTQLNEIQLKAGDFERNITVAEGKIKHLTEEKEGLEQKIEMLMDSTQNSDVHLQKLNMEIKRKDDVINQLRDETVNDQQKFKREIQSLKMELDSSREEAAKNKSELESSFKEVSEAKQLLQVKLEEVMLERSISNQSLTRTIAETNELLEQSKRDMEKIQKDYEKSQNESQMEIEKLNSSIKETVAKNQKEIELLTKEHAVKLQTYTDELEKSRMQLADLEAKNVTVFSQNEGEIAKLSEQNAASQKLLDELKSECEALKRDNLRTSEEKTALEESVQNYKSTIDSLNSKVAHFDKLSEDYESKSKSQQDLISSLQSSVVNFESEMSSLKTDLLAKTKDNEELNKTVCELKEQIASISSLQNEKTESVSALNGDLLILRERYTDIENALRAKETELTELLACHDLEKKKCIDLETNVSVNAEKLSQASDRNAALLNEIKELQKSIEASSKHTSEVDEVYKKEITALKGSLTEKEEAIAKMHAESAKLLEESESKANLLKRKDDEIMQLNDQAERLQRQADKSGKDLAEAMSALEIKEKEQHIREEEIKCKLQTDFKVASDLLVGQIEGMKKDQAKLNSQPKDDGAIQKLRLETSSLSLSLQEKTQEIEKLKSENYLLQQDLLSMKNQTVKKETISATTAQSVNEDSAFMEGKINFLNSIIVDMQRKNQDLSNKIQELESQFSDRAIAELNLPPINPRVAAPRLYCDICEEFDLHETEDCPHQDSESKVEYTPRRALKPPDAYCDMCHVFGHATEDCTDDTTF